MTTTTTTEELLELNSQLTDAIMWRALAQHWNKPRAEELTIEINTIRNEIKEKTRGEGIRHTGNRICEVKE